MSLRLTFARTDCYPYDTLCTYEVEQFDFRGFLELVAGLEPATC